MLSEKIRGWTQPLRGALGRLIGRWGISPNSLTICGYLLHLPVLWALATGHFAIGGVLLALASAFDALDGSVAREMGRVTQFGAFLDSVLDRFSEATVLLGLLLYYVQRGAHLEPVLIYLAVVGSTMVSYTRARAEGLGVECKEGLFTRFERVVLLVVGLLIGQVQPALWVLALLTIFTAIQRVYYVWRKAAQ
jgi:CDP-diacylglycerol--glycerol-3-phosphate 3-phosphatidyltransferase